MASKLRVLGGCVRQRSLSSCLRSLPSIAFIANVVIDRLWPDADPDAAANNFHQALHAARRFLGNDRIVLRDEMVVLGPGGDIAVDVDGFVAAAASVDGTPGSLEAALARWTGELLPEDLYEDWATPHRERLANRRARLLVQLASALVEQGRAGEAVLVLEPLAAERPDDEEVHRVLLAALFASGRRSDASRVFDRLRDALAELGAAPSRAMADMYRQLSTGSGVGRAVVANNLPASTSSFVGRARELRDLTAAMDRSRLVTITGPGGRARHGWLSNSLVDTRRRTAPRWCVGS